MEHAISLTWKTIIDMVDGFFKLLPNLIIGGFIFFLFTQLAKYVRKIVVSICSHAHFDLTLSQALGNLSGVATDVFGVLVAMTIIIPSFKASQLIAGLGITSVAVGFAFKDILQNFFAGLLLLWQKPFKIGDQIKTRDFEGTVDQIDIHSTRIITHNGQLVVLPNGDVFTNPIIINTAFERLRQHLTVSGLPGVSLDEARNEIAKTVASTAGVLQTPLPQVYMANADDGAPKFDVYFWCKPKESEVLTTIDNVATAVRRLMTTKGKEAKVETANGDTAVNAETSVATPAANSAGDAANSATSPAVNPESNLPTHSISPAPLSQEYVAKSEDETEAGSENLSAAKRIQQQAAAAVVSKSPERPVERFGKNY